MPFLLDLPLEKSRHVAVCVVLGALSLIPVWHFWAEGLQS